MAHRFLCGMVLFLGELSLTSGECKTTSRVDLHLTFVGVKASSECNGSTHHLDHKSRDYWAVDGFGDCYNDTQGWVTFKLKDRSFVECIEIYNPSTSHMRADLYGIGICDGGICGDCDPLPVVRDGWSETQCDLVGDTVLLTKKALTQFQLGGIDMTGYAPQLAFKSIEADQTCKGDVALIDDNKINASTSDNYYAECSENINGSVKIELDHRQFVEIVRLLSSTHEYAGYQRFIVEVCTVDSCEECGKIPVTPKGEFAVVYCGMFGNSVVLRKRFASKFQLVEVDIHGYEPRLTGFSVESETTCIGNTEYIQDRKVDYGLTSYGFADCSEGLDGWVKMGFRAGVYVTYVKILTPPDGHTRNDFYKLEICYYGKCRDCMPVPRSAPGEWSRVECGLKATELKLSKIEECQMQLTEVEIYGYDTDYETDASNSTEYPTPLWLKQQIDANANRFRSDEFALVLTTSFLLALVVN